MRTHRLLARVGKNLRATSRNLGDIPAGSSRSNQKRSNVPAATARADRDDDGRAAPAAKAAQPTRAWGTIRLCDESAEKVNRRERESMTNACCFIRIATPRSRPAPKSVRQDPESIARRTRRRPPIAGRTMKWEACANGPRTDALVARRA
jgi:hypothetical protein